MYSTVHQISKVALTWLVDAQSQSVESDWTSTMVVPLELVVDYTVINATHHEEECVARAPHCTVKQGGHCRS